MPKLRVSEDIIARGLWPYMRATIKDAAFSNGCVILSIEGEDVPECEEVELRITSYRNDNGFTGEKLEFRPIEET